jgi:peptide/nickel transport system substrate-binding protein
MAVFPAVPRLLRVSCAFALVAQGAWYAHAYGGARFGGVLVVAERSQPRTLNPALAADNVSREAIGLLHADLVHINRASLGTEPALATSWKISPDGKRYLLKLRPDVKFSDGHPFDADDVIFTWQIALDENVHSPQRDLLIVGGKPVTARKIDSHTVEFLFSQPYGPAERIFDGISILPRHLLEGPFAHGKFPQSWGLNNDAASMAGLGPFRLKQYTPGQRLVLERNPYYWKTGAGGMRLPYLDSVVFDFASSEAAQVLRFESGDVDSVSRISAANFDALASRSAGRWQLRDAGPGLEYNFLFFNLNDLGSGAAVPKYKQAWFADANFRRAISTAIDREAIARLVYQGRATPIWTNVTPANKFWMNAAIPRPPQSLDTARRLLGSCAFKWNRKGTLEDKAGNAVEFTIATNAGNAERAQMATVIQGDLKKLGIAVRTTTFEMRSLIDRITNTMEYEAALLGLVAPDADPAPDTPFLLSTGGSHFWRLRRTAPEPEWQVEIDRLMAAQMSAPSSAERKRAYDRVQQLFFENAPVVALVSPNVLCAWKSGLQNVRPAILPPYTLWNADELYWDASGRSR